MSEIINVGLYGDGSRDARLRAEYIRCDRACECSAYQAGTCFFVTTLYGVRCRFGQVQCVDGGTKRSKAFSVASGEAKSHPCYAKLRYPNHTYVTKIGGAAFLTLPYIRLEEVGDGRILCSDPGFIRNGLTLDADKLTPENVRRICDAKPRSMFGSGTISDYQNKAVPMFLHQLRQVFPEQYEAFLAAHPDFIVKPPDWKGRRAKLATCNRSEQYLSGNNRFRFDGEYLVCEEYSSAFAPFADHTMKTEIHIRVTDDMVVTITDNNQVTGETVFV